MKQVKYKSYEELPLMLSVPEVAAVLGIFQAGAYELWLPLFESRLPHCGAEREVYRVDR